MSEQSITDGAESSDYTHYPNNVPVGYRPILKQKAVHKFEWNSNDTENSEHKSRKAISPIGIRAAWSVVLCQYSGSNEIVFGTNPNISQNKNFQHVVPFRVKVDWQSNASTWLKTVESLMAQVEQHVDGGEVQPIACTVESDYIPFSNALMLENGLSQVDDSADNEDAFGAPLALLVKCDLASESKLSISTYFDSDILDAELVEHILHQFELMVHQLGCENDHLTKLRLGELNTVSEQSKALVWSWNSKRPSTIHDWIPNLFAHQLQINPERPAVHAWDGKLSYAELDYKSTLLASWLLRNKVAERHSVLPICFDKTFWTTIALLAAAKIGATFIMIDPYQPRGRLASILSKFDYCGMLAREDTFELARSLTSKSVYIVDNELLAQDQQGDTTLRQQFCPGSPEDPLYIVFTSGSTGEPKGITISHYNLCSAVGHQARKLGFAGSRTFDSSSYSFDAYVCNTFHTLLTGGCLCVPSEYDRINNLEAVLQEMEVDFVQLTPSTSSVLDPVSLPLLRTLILTGEKITRSVLDPWLLTGRVRVINAYGPSECTIMCSANTSISCIEDAANIGNGLGANLWIADVNNVERLAPAGAVGELLIDGPIIGQGYLRDPKRTEQSLVRITGGFLPGIAPCPEDTLFRTGDLARYNMDGSIRFIGRADTQIKINGQRVEIGEVEHRLAQILPDDYTAVVEAVEWPSGKKQLIGFIHSTAIDAKPPRKIAHPLREKLLSVLPAYMVPSAYFMLDHIPKTSSGKTDRRTLRNLALKTPADLIDAHATLMDSTNKPFSHTESFLRTVWAEVLDLREEDIRQGDSFFSCGGDSLAAIRMVAALNRMGKFGVGVTDIFQNPHLFALAKSIDQKKTTVVTLDASSAIAPFSLLPPPHGPKKLLREAAAICGCNEADIEDIYPCSPVQEEMVVLSSRNPKGFVTQKVVDLSTEVTLTQILADLKALELKLPILRTRIIESHEYEYCLMQVVLKGESQTTVYDSTERCLQQELQDDIGLGDRLFKISIINEIDQGSLSLVFTMHHALYDGWTLNLISEELSRSCSGGTPTETVEYKSFIKHLQSTDTDASASFWYRSLKNAALVNYPTFPVPDYKPISTAVLEQAIWGIDWRNLKEATPTTLVHAAWSMTLSKLSRSSDIVYGTTLLGRQTPMAGIEHLAGPTLASVPLRTFVDWGKETVAQFLHTVQQQLVDTIPFMHYGLKNIQKLGYDADAACRFRTFLVIQPEEQSSPTDILKLGTGSDDIGAFNSYGMMIECSLTRDGCILRSSFDGKVLSDEAIRSTLNDFERSLKLLIESANSVALSELPFLTGDELQNITSGTSMYGDQSIKNVSGLFKHHCSHFSDDAAVELIETAGIGKQLVGFFCSNQPTLDNDMLRALARVQEQLSQKLPRHMLPSTCVAMERLPKNEKGAVDAASLASELDSLPSGCCIALTTLQQHITPHDQPETDAEITLQNIWASVLGVEPPSISRESSFLQLGGNSLSAMRVVSAARKQGYHCSVSDIFRSPMLMEVAQKARFEKVNPLGFGQIEPFSLVKLGVDKQKLGSACGLDASLVEDAYPCSPLQEAMMATTIQSPGTYVSKNISRLDASVDIGRLQNAWNSVAASVPILRTRIVESDGHGLLQVVIAGGVLWTEHSDARTLPAQNMTLGEPLMRFDLVKDSSGIYLHSMVHHAAHDRWSASLILEQVEQAYEGNSSNTRLLPFNYFIKYILKEQSQQQSAKAYWRNYFMDLDAPDFPALPNTTYQPEAKSFCTKHVSAKWPEQFTPTTVLKAAFALLISQYTGSNDVLFDMTLLGRQSALPGIDLVAGPTITTIPLRFKLNQYATVSSYLEALQVMAIEMIPFEHYGVAQIQRISPEAKRACQAQASLVIQPPERVATTGLFGLLVDGADEKAANDQAFALECTLQGESDQVFLSLNFDDQVIDHLQAERMLSQLEYIIHELCQSNLRDTTIRQLSLPNSADLKELYDWSEAIPSNEDQNILDMIIAHVRESPDSIAIDAWDLSLTYTDLCHIARRLAYFLMIHHGIAQGQVVPICLEKSALAPVAMLAVIFTGGAAVTMDSAQPTERLATIMHTVDAQVALASPTTASILQKSSECAVYCLDESSILNLPSPPLDFTFPIIPNEAPLYINFTSGSTGTPKGAIVTHGNCSSAVLHQAMPLGFDQNTRVLDLSSYSFDVVWELLLQVLCSGGCLCIPSDDDRLNDISKAIKAFNVNLLDITPSLARTLAPDSLPSVKRIIFGGEVLALDDISPWESCGVEVLNTYGPSECTPTATIAQHGVDFTDKMMLGRCFGLNSWIVSCTGSNNLVPIGGVGELILEGPLVGKGYLNDDKKTSEVFLEDFPWFHRAGKEMDRKPCGRLYKTGDLVRYNSQGMLLFEGRKDTQVKIRGQRVELDEIEFQSRRVVATGAAVAAEVIAASGSQTLALFIEDEHTLTDDTKSDLEARLAKHFSQVLPKYMVPSVYIFGAIPRTASGKVNRRQLREDGAALQSERLRHQPSELNKPGAPGEEMLSRLWASVLGVEERMIGRESSFLDLGGDSLTAIRLVGQARENGLPLTVALVFQCPKLLDMAATVTKMREQLSNGHGLTNGDNDSEPLGVGAEKLPTRESVAKLLSVPDEAITDILPLTDFQSYTIACAMNTPRTEWNYISVHLPQTQDASQLPQICTKLVQLVEVFRCIFVPNGSGGYSQAILSHLEPNIETISTSNSLDMECQVMCMKDWKADVAPSSSLIKFFIFKHETSFETRLAMRIPHAQYDGFSFGPLCDVIGAICSNSNLPPLPSFSSYMKNMSISSPSAEKIWKQVLEDSAPPTSISTPQLPRRPSKRHVEHCQVSLAGLPQGITPSTILYAAWGMAVAKLSDTPDVVFGRAVSGRAASTTSTSHDNVIGPCLNIVPTRLALRNSDKKEDVLRSLQSQILESIEHETLRLGEITRRCTNWGSDATLGSVVYFQKFQGAKEDVSPDANSVRLEAIAMDRPDPPEPPRLDILPLSEEQYRLELMVSTEEMSAVQVKNVLDLMQACLQELRV